MSLPRLSSRQKAALAVALAVLLWAPTGISTHEHTMITGHSTFYDGDTYDPCLASIAGLIRNRVMWFNDQVLVETYGGRGTFVFVTEDGAKDPTETGRRLYSEGTFYDFVDPNGAHWHVEEAFMIEDVKEEAKLNTNDMPTKKGYDPGYAAVSQNRTYVWIVELSAKPIYDDFAGADPHTFYNFLLLVDTCKMKRAYSQPGRTGENDPHYNVTHDGAILNKNYGHPDDAEMHNHEAHLANLWFGKRPTLTPIGPTDTRAMWETDWATGYADSQGHYAERESGQEFPK